MTRFFYDTEFYENGSTIDLLSFGLVNDTDGAERYWINLDADLNAIPPDHWLIDNVLPHLPIRRAEHGERMSNGVKSTIENPGLIWDLEHPDAQYLRPRDAIAGELRAFITSYGVSSSMHELWAWYGAYDHVALSQLFGRMVDLPESVPMHTCDLKQLVGTGTYPLPKQMGDLHNALADARWVREAWRAVMSRQDDERRTLDRWAVERSESHRHLRALDVAWRFLSVQERAAIRAAVPDATLWGLLHDAEAVVKAAG